METGKMMIKKVLIARSCPMFFFITTSHL